MGYNETEDRLAISFKGYAAGYGDTPKDGHPWSCVDAFKSLSEAVDAEGSSYSDLYSKTACERNREEQEAFILAFIETRVKPLADLLLDLPFYAPVQPKQGETDNHRGEAALTQLECVTQGDLLRLDRQAEAVHQRAASAIQRIEDAIRIMLEAFKQAEAME